ncbi:membrane protein insertion efficiency factor YidD [Ruminococcus sp.]|uniref:membrane protein insertion efficiency factor YidD n=1 Tax=Ruminococcus sp. TaxID=41978 RepID=UPI002603408F|nr:membrane protein insertion efficiency factor YidD [Ruminococcus sp.]MDD7556967.1 membrane protein insertion efficiency factor YidD [Ruminococcus sp.]MDY4963493.1 membrane protein insertion efficiency factor YidD [Ruminococcus callidus]
MKHAAMLLIRFYRKCISPLLPRCCKYYPSCSAYALGAFERFGFFRGMWLALWRLLRCNPWSKGGFDPVPQKFDILGRHTPADFPPEDN